MRAQYSKAVRIGIDERDRSLRLGRRSWPAGVAPDGWEVGDGYLSRVIERRGKQREELARSVEELILRFPSAPLHAFRRLHNEPVAESMHTYRVLRHPTYRGPVQRVFLMHNGLDELAKMNLYYQLASHLIKQQEGTVCILRPFPGHLTRSPHQAFSDTPLGTYLWDGSNLFRQFLTFMIETQWFLSALARRSSYRCASGIALLAESPEPSRSRIQARVLAGAVKKDWDRMYDSSKESLASDENIQHPTTQLPPRLSERQIRESIVALRKTLRLEEHYPAMGGDLPDPPAGTGAKREEPPLHVIGYSLGGFAAQSIFMSWPFMVSSCVTLLSGGALRELAPSAFAHPEEWQTVLHSLRYELDDALMRGRRMTPDAAPGETPSTADDEGHVAGMDRDLFLCLKRTFYEVFQQEYRGSFQTRLSGFRRRMLFVVGGNDPIVRPESVLDSSPEGGVNMVAIGGLGHFLGDPAQDTEEQEQRTFWIPEVAKVTYRFANDAAARQYRERPQTWLDQDMNLPFVPIGTKEAPDTRLRRLDVSERLGIGGDGSLPGALFRRCLEDLLARVDGYPDDGVLFILRNEVPTLLLEDRAIQEHAASLHHHDLAVASYTRAVRARKDVLLGRPDRISVVLPWSTKAIMERIDLHPRHPSQGESVGSMVVERTTPLGVWESFVRQALELTADEPEAVRMFKYGTRIDGAQRAGKPSIDIRALRDTAKRPAGREPLASIPALPDCWIWMSRDFLQGFEDHLTIADARKALCAVAPHYYANEKLLGRQLRDDRVRIVTVSRARYNPRFRGRIVANPKAARHLLLHAALCVAASVPFGHFLEREHPEDVPEAA